MKKTAKAPISATLVPILCLMGLLYFLFFFHLGSYSLFDMDEPRYAEAAREMVESGNWITPTFNYDLRFDKPVFFYWLIAIAYKLFGVSEFSARLFSAISASMMVLLTYGFARFWVSPRFGLLSALVLATSMEVIGLARMSVTDMTLSFFMTATTLTLFLVAHHSRKWWLVAGILSGLAVLTKGPVGIVVPGAILVLYAMVTGRLKHCFFTPWFAAALAACVAVAIPWYILAYLENGKIFLDALFLHNFTRYSDVVSGHDQPWYFYSLVLIAGFLPWSVFLPASLTYWFKQLKTKGAFLSGDTPMLANMVLFAALWAVFVFVFFSVAQTKLLTYILPMFPALALLMGATFEQATREQEEKKGSGLTKALTWSAAALCLIFLVVGGLFCIKMSMFLPREAKHISQNPENYIAVILLILGTALAVWMLTRKKVVMAIASQSVTMVALTAVALSGIVPHINQATQGSMISFLEKAGESPLITYEITRPSLTYYARKKIIHVPKHDRATLVSLLKAHASFYVITKNSFLEELSKARPEQSDLKLLEQGPRYSLLMLEEESQQTK